MNKGFLFLKIKSLSSKSAGCLHKPILANDTRASLEAELQKLESLSSAKMRTPIGLLCLFKK